MQPDAPYALRQLADVALKGYGQMSPKPAVGASRGPGWRDKSAGHSGGASKNRTSDLILGAR